MSTVALPVLIAAAMPFVLTGIAKAGAFGRRDNLRPREWQAGLTGWRQRAHWAHLNAFEAFPAFAAAALLAEGAAPGSGAIPALAWGFVAARVVFAACYVADLGLLRSLVWTAGAGCNLGLFALAL